jgi:serine/threonine protein kinase
MFQKPLLFAIKRLTSECQEQFDAEVKMLNLFRRREHPHIIRLLATFRYKQRYHLIFLGAKSNLREYWKSSPSPSFTDKVVLWFLTQCAGVVSGLREIHISRRTGLQTQCGRHGDLKPENLLYSYDNIIIIADFGTMDLHGENSTKINPEHIAGSSIYAPPEARLDLGLKISRSYDIWSLACCFIEFMTWLLMGWDGLEEFCKLRRDGFGDDTFYNIDKRECASSTAAIRGSVFNWIQRLRHHDNCSQFCQDFLDLVTNRMLLVNSDERISCAQLNVEFLEMMKNAENEPDYLTKPVHEG